MIIIIIIIITILQHIKMSNPKGIEKLKKLEKKELARETVMEEIERLKIFIEGIQKIELARKISTERLEKLDIEIDQIENQENLDDLEIAIDMVRKN